MSQNYARLGLASNARFAKTSLTLFVLYRSARKKMLRRLIQVILTLLPIT